jgi:hypothetical protein
MWIVQVALRRPYTFIVLALIRTRRMTASVLPIKGRRKTTCERIFTRRRLRVRRGKDA